VCFRELEIETIKEIAGSIGIDEKYLELYGNYKAKIQLEILEELKKMILQVVKFPDVNNR
jgi:formyltetrahydrofolate synthetase